MKDFKKGKGNRNHENSQLYRGVVRTNKTSKMELFTKMVNGLESLSIYEKSSILNVWLTLTTPLI